MVNVAERSDVKLLEKRARLYAAQNAEVLKGIMSTAYGRQWMYDLLEQAHIGTTPFDTDVARMSFNCGEQNLGLRLWAALQTTCPVYYILMMQEHNEREHTAPGEFARSQDAGRGTEVNGASGWSHHDERAGDSEVARDA